MQHLLYTYYFHEKTDISMIFNSLLLSVCYITMLCSVYLYVERYNTFSIVITITKI
jgi:hypothetical protein